MKTIYKGGVVRIESQGPAAVLQYAIQEVQEPKGHEILISQKAIAINFVDIMYRNGTFPISSFPATIGGEAAGIVENVGSEVTAFKEGDRVAYYNALGSYAEQRLVRTEDLVKLPDDISYDQAASILAKGLTARMLIRQIYPVKPGDIILVHAAAGGVGSLLSKWAKALGATVIGTVGTEAKRAIASDNGVDHVIVLETQDLEAKVKELIGNQRIDAVFDGVGKATFNISLRLLNKIGGIILFRGPVYESVILMNRMQQLARYPLLISADLEAGAGMRFDDTVNFPWNMAVAATGNPDFARRQGEITAREARALGVHQIFAPVVDVNNNAANPVINVRSYGEDATDVARFAAAFTEGAQSAGAIATAKHFPGHGDTAVDSHRGLPEINVTRERLNSVEFVPFQASVNAGVGSVMVGHIALPQIDSTAIRPLPRNIKSKPIDTDEGGEIIEEKATMPATLSPVMGRILRNDLKFSGMIVTDALSMSGLTIYFTPEESAVRALEAGADMLLKPADVDATFRGVREAVKSGRITEQRLEESVRKLLAWKYDLGLVEQRIAPLDAIDRVVGSRDVHKLAGEIAERAITLVRDEDKLLPLKNLKPDTRVFNLAITNGDDRNWISNSFVGKLNRSGVKVETIVLDDRSSEQDVQKAIELAKSANVVFASMYGRVRSGQVLSVGLPNAGSRALNAIIEAKLPVIGISFGNPYLLQNYPGLRAYVVAYGDMPSLQHAVARAVMGEIDIVGKLPISLPGLYPRGTGIQLKASK